jgi:hypothetical protein
MATLSQFSDAEIDTEDISQQPQQHVLSTTFRSPTSRAARVILFRDARFFLNKNTGFASPTKIIKNQGYYLKGTIYELTLILF